MGLFTTAGEHWLIGLGPIYQREIEVSLVRPRVRNPLYAGSNCPPSAILRAQESSANMSPKESID